MLRWELGEIMDHLLDSEGAPRHLPFWGCSRDFPREDALSSFPSDQPVESTCLAFHIPEAASTPFKCSAQEAQVTYPRAAIVSMVSPEPGQKPDLGEGIENIPRGP